ncbi:MAG: DUF4340 domain-containing protein, partial [Planctomycetota bacterium]|nr:DUF4340 domain-containing protein [Planctomycetota bacterium]
GRLASPFLTMHRRTLFFLVLLVLGLGLVARWQKQREERGDFTVLERLFPEVTARSIQALRLDHIERSFHLRLVRGDDMTQWLITDPIEYEADEGFVERLLDVVLTHRVGVPPGQALASDGGGAASEAPAGFDPPRASLTVEWVTAQGEARESVLEIGPVDLDGNHVAVRVIGAEGPGPVRRTLRNLDTLLARTLNEWRSKRLSRLAPRTLVSFTREGTLFLGEGEDSLWLDMTLERAAATWRMVRPQRVTADRDAVELLAAGVARVVVEKFAADVAETREALALFGLEQPELRLVLEDHQGRTEVLEFGRAVMNGNWFARRVGEPEVFEVAGHAVLALTPPSELFMERKLMRLARERVDEITITGTGPPLVITRGGQSALGGVGQALAASDEHGWRVAQGALEWPADGERVGALLADLEQAEVLHYLRGAEAPYAELAEPGLSFTLRGGRVHEGGRLGGAWSGADDGEAGLVYLRKGDATACVVPAALGETLAVSILELRQRRLVMLEEVKVARLVIAGGGEELVFDHGRDGRWRRGQGADNEDTDPSAATGAGPAEALELHPLLDPLLFLQAQSFMPVAEAPPLLEPVRITIAGRDGSSSWLELGRVAGTESTAEARGPGLRARLADDGLHRQLLDLLGG